MQPSSAQSLQTVIEPVHSQPVQQLTMSQSMLAISTNVKKTERHVWLQLVHRAI